jgi:integrase
MGGRQSTANSRSRFDFSMLNDTVSPATESLYSKVPGVVGLYRHAVSGRYYGVKKIKGKRRERSLDTTDRKIAERRLKEWIAGLEKVDGAVEKTTLGQLRASFVAVNKGKSDSSQCIIEGVLREFEAWWPHGLDFQVRNIRPSHLEEWLAMQERRLKNTTYNRYAGVLKQMFQLAVNDRIIAESPFERVTTRWKKPQTPIRRNPTIEQFEAIVADIRSQKYSRNAEATADFVEFLGLAGLGQAEASSLTWGDVDFAQSRIAVRRHKTDRRFPVPMYPHLRPLMERLQAKAGSGATPPALVFKIKDAKRALSGACERLGLPHFSQRNLRQCLIMRLWKLGVDKKLIAKWQGHQDGGQLILDTYTEVFGADDAEYERLQLAKLAPAVNVVGSSAPPENPVSNEAPSDGSMAA